MFGFLDIVLWLLIKNSVNLEVKSDSSGYIDALELSVRDV